MALFLGSKAEGFKKGRRKVTLERAFAAMMAHALNQFSRRARQGHVFEASLSFTGRARPAWTVWKDSK